MGMIGSRGIGMTGTLQTGKSGLAAAQAGIANAGHNIANANSEGFSRQRISQTAEVDRSTGLAKTNAGSGARVSSVERLNDRFVEKQLRNANRDLSFAEEKDVLLKQVEDVFNEMGGEGLNRLLSRFFNEFRKLSNEPESEAIRQSVREASNAVVRDLRRLRGQVDQIISHADSRLEGYVREAQAHAEDIAQLNLTVQALENNGGASNDLMDQRDLALKKLGSLMDVAMYTDNFGGYTVDIKGFGPLVVSGRAERLSTERTDGREGGKPANAMDVFLTNSSPTPITDKIHGGRIGALVEVRDRTLSAAAAKLDDIAFELARAVNEVHRQGFTNDGQTQMDFFKAPVHRQGAAGMIDLADSIRESPHNIAVAAAPDSPADNRIALALSNIQGMRLMSEGRTTMDDFYNSIVSEVGVVSNQNKLLLNQSKDVATQLGKIREQVSGVSIDEETTKLMQYQHAFDASARVIRVADEMMKTILSLKE